MTKKIILRAGIPLFIMTSISLMLFLIGNPETEYLSTFYTGLIVSIVSGATIIYEINHWSLLKQSIIHFLLMLVTIFPILVISNWFPNNTIQDIAIILIVFLISGLVMWTIAYFINTKLVKK